MPLPSLCLTEPKNKRRAGSNATSIDDYLSVLWKLANRTRQRIKPAAGLIFIRLQQVRSVVVGWARTGAQLNEKRERERAGKEKREGEGRTKRINEGSSRATYSPRPFVRWFWKREPEFLR